MWCLGLEGSPQRGQEKQREGEREGGENVTKLLNLGIRITWEAFEKYKCPGLIPGNLDSVTKVKVKVAQSCPTLCDPMDQTVHGILQANILEWVPFPSPGDLPNPGLKPSSPVCGHILYQLSHKGTKVRSLEW